MSEERFLSTEEVAERLQVDEQTVRRWIKSGKLEAFKPGREWRISPAAFEALLASYSSPKAHSGAKTGKERQADRLAPRIKRLQPLDLGDLSEHRRELEERLADLKVPVTKEEFFAGKDPFEDYEAYLETTDELLATLMVLERKAGRVRQ